MLMAAGKASEYLYSMPVFFGRHTKIDIYSFSSIKNFDDLLEATKKSVYNEILLPFRPPNGNGTVDILQIEAALYTYLYDVVFHIIDKYTPADGSEGQRNPAPPVIVGGGLVECENYSGSHQSPPCACGDPCIIFRAGPIPEAVQEAPVAHFFQVWLINQQ